MEVIRSGKALGAEIKGIDLSQNLSQDEINVISEDFIRDLKAFIRPYKLLEE